MLREFQLTEQQIETFVSSGYVLIRRVFDVQDIVKIDTWAREVENTPADSRRYWVYREKSRLEPGRMIICRIENIISHHAGFMALSTILQVAIGQLLGEPAILFKDKINFKNTHIIRKITPFIIIIALFSFTQIFLYSLNSKVQFNSIPVFHLVGSMFSNNQKTELNNFQEKNNEAIIELEKLNRDSSLFPISIIDRKTQKIINDKLKNIKDKRP